MLDYPDVDEMVELKNNDKTQDVWNTMYFDMSYSNARWRYRVKVTFDWLLDYSIVAEIECKLQNPRWVKVSILPIPILHGNKFSLGIHINDGNFWGKNFAV